MLELDANEQEQILKKLTATYRNYKGCAEAQHGIYQAMLSLGLDVRVCHAAIHANTTQEDVLRRELEEAQNWYRETSRRMDLACNAREAAILVDKQAFERRQAALGALNDAGFQ